MLQQMEHMYCSQQIDIPPKFPQILKEYAKDAIRTQPADLLLWSACYFRCLANGIPVPAKKRIEVPPTVSRTGLTPGFIAVLIKQFGHISKIDRDVLWKRWIGVCLCDEELKKMLILGKMLKTPKIPWIKFVALMIGHLCNSLTETMIMFCEIMTNEPDGGSAMVPFSEFKEAYIFLAQLDCGSTQKFKEGRKVVDKTRSSEKRVEYKSESDTSTVSTHKEAVGQSGSKQFYVGTHIVSDVISKDALAGKHGDIIIDAVIDNLVGEEATEEFDLDKLDLNHKKVTSVSMISEQASSVDIFPIHADAIKSQVVYEDDVNEDEEDIEGYEQCEIEQLPEEKGDYDAGMLDFDDGISVHTFTQVFDVDKSTTVTRTTLNSNVPSRVASNSSTVDTISLSESEEEAIVSYAEPAVYWDKKEEKSPCGLKPDNMDLKKDGVIYIESIKGIGPVVPILIVKTFMEYMECCANNQHNMIMPRNMRHYTCPNLEPNPSQFESEMVNIDIIY